MQNQFKTNDDKNSQVRRSYGSKKDLKDKQSQSTASKRMIDPALNPSKNILVSDSVIKNGTPDNLTDDNQDLNVD